MITVIIPIITIIIIIITDLVCVCTYQKPVVSNAVTHRLYVLEMIRSGTKNLWRLCAYDVCMYVCMCVRV